ncbi:MAG: sugar phosphate isomerase/epimerase family protein [Candidatus Syntropharchaeales archaeon]
MDLIEFGVTGSMVLAKMADDYSITLLIENLPDKNGYDRIGILPQEILSVVESVNEDNLKVVFDVGHGNLTSSLYDFDIMVFFDYLAPYIHHIHIHDNMGIPAVIDPDFGDQHLPLGAGSINFNRIFEGVKRTRAENLVLEIKNNGSRLDALTSIEVLKRFRSEWMLDIKTNPYLTTVLNSL